MGTDVWQHTSTVTIKQADIPAALAAIREAAHTLADTPKWPQYYGANPEVIDRITDLDEMVKAISEDASAVCDEDGNATIWLIDSAVCEGRLRCSETIYHAIAQFIADGATACLENADGDRWRYRFTNGICLAEEAADYYSPSETKIDRAFVHEVEEKLRALGETKLAELLEASLK